MAKGSKTEAQKAKQAIELYNIIPSIFWTVINCVPLAVFCYKNIELKWLYGILALSLPVLWLPASLLSRFQLGKTTAIYKKIGMRFVKKFTQDGDVVNGLIRKKYPHHNLIEDRKGLRKQVQKTWLNERFHFAMFLFFLLCTVYALSGGFFLWALAISLNNLIFNVYPIFLQQYTRLRLNHVRGKAGVKWPENQRAGDAI